MHNQGQGKIGITSYHRMCVTKAFDCSKLMMSWTIVSFCSFYDINLTNHILRFMSHKINKRTEGEIKKYIFKVCLVIFTALLEMRLPIVNLIVAILNFLVNVP